MPKKTKRSKTEKAIESLINYIDQKNGRYNVYVRPGDLITELLQGGRL